MYWVSNSLLVDIVANASEHFIISLSSSFFLSLFIHAKKKKKIKRIAVAPSTMQMQNETGQTLQNGTVIGPLSEGQRFVSYCEARSGRPRPNVGWHLNGKRLAGNVLFSYFSIERTHLPFQYSRSPRKKTTRKCCFFSLFLLRIFIVKPNALYFAGNNNKKNTISREIVQIDCINTIEWSQRLG